MGRIVWGGAVFLALAGLYLFLAGSIDAVEIAATLVCAGVGTALAVGLEIVAKRNFAPLPPPRAIVNPILALLPELSVVGRELVAAILDRAKPGRGVQERGALLRQPFEPGGDAPRDAARRAISIIGISLAPRTFAVRGERTDTLLLHALPRKPPSPDKMWPA